MNKKIDIKVCTGTGGTAAGGNEVLATFKAILSSSAVAGGCSVQKVGCRGFCSKDVLVDVIVNGDKTTYTSIKPDMVERIIQEHIIDGNPVAEWTVGEKYLNFHKKQAKVVLAHCGEIDPEDINAYRSVGGYEAARMALTSMNPEEIVEIIKSSKLRGRGGAGFPTGIKWEVGLKALLRRRAWANMVGE